MGGAWYPGNIIGGPGGGPAQETWSCHQEERKALGMSSLEDQALPPALFWEIKLNVGGLGLG